MKYRTVGEGPIDALIEEYDLSAWWNWEGAGEDAEVTLAGLTDEEWAALADDWPTRDAAWQEKLTYALAFGPRDKSMPILEAMCEASASRDVYYAARSALSQLLERDDP